MSDKEVHDDKAFSTHLSFLLDKIGYNQQIVNSRRDFYEKNDQEWNQKHDRLTRVTAGSKAEGYSTYCESDTDFLYVYRNIVCIDSDTWQRIPDKEVTVFQMLSDGCFHGHYKLKRIKRGTIPVTKTVAKSFLTPRSTDTNISNFKFRKALLQHLSVHVKGGRFSREYSGPAVSRKFKGRKHDIVYSFRCNSQENILSEWISRPRKYAWPSRELIQEVTKLEAQMVPVGSRLSECRDLEWRICFIPGEMKLTHSLNEAQYKIYILLKLFNKSVLKLICSEMSSYIMKNIVYWLVEEHPTERFTADNLFENLMMALTKLHQAIKDNYLPYYMLPGRNLLCGRISEEHVEPLGRIIETLRKEGPRLIFRCKKIKDAWALPITELAIKGVRNDETEKAVLELREFKDAFRFMPNLSWQEKDIQLYKTEEYMNLCIKVRDATWPEWREYPGSNEQIKKEIKKRIEQMLL